MFDEVDRRVMEWARQVVGDDAVVALADPAHPTVSDGAPIVVSIYFYCVVPETVLRPRGEPEREIARLRYFITVQGDDVEATHRVLGDLFFAVESETDFTVVCERLEPSFWLALGVSPQPCVVIEVPAVREKSTTVAGIVREPLVLKQSPLGALFGRVVGPGGVPMSHATVEIEGSQLSTRTDPRGGFAFAAAPPRPRLTIRARGKNYTVNVEEASPLVVEITQLEDLES